MTLVLTVKWSLGSDDETATIRETRDGESDGVWEGDWGGDGDQDGE